MPYPQLDRFAVRMKPLAERQNKKLIERDHVSPDGGPPEPLAAPAQKTLAEAAARIAVARAAHKPVMLAFGAHTIKNGLAPVLIQLLDAGWLTHLATNGAGIIHDWEFAFQGMSSENVRQGIAAGEFGHWQETGYYLNLALNIGAYEGKGYGEAVGAMIENEALMLPAAGDLESEVATLFRTDPARAAAAADLLALVRRHSLTPGRIKIKHPWKAFSVQAAACRLKVPFTGHPMFGHDIIYNHPMNHGASIGRVAERDFLTFAESVSRISGGVYISLGSAVMSPMIFEKSMSMAQNLALQQGRHIAGHYTLVVDLAEAHWDWADGEPPESNPDYYLRYNKTFSRTGGTLRYLQADNRVFLLALWHALRERNSAVPPSAGSAP